MTDEKPLKHLCLEETHRGLNARMMEFAGWLMPVSYSGTVDEHLTVRKKVGLFDVSHMGQISVYGKDAVRELNRLTVNDVSGMGPGQVQYNAMCYPNGGVVDDITVYRLGPDEYFLCVNAANSEKDLRWITDNISGEVRADDRSQEFCLLALQGPMALATLGATGCGLLRELKYYKFTQDPVLGVRALVSRSGYTGEDGFEIYVNPLEAKKVWEGLMEAGSALGIKPAGLGARDTLRIEMRYPLYGHELTAETTPLEAGLGWIVKLGKGEFLGRDALLLQKEKGLDKKLVGFQIDGGTVPRSDNIITVRGRPVGRVTSGTYSPSLKRPIGIGYIEASLARDGELIHVGIRGKEVPARIVPTPFYRGGSIVRN